MQYARKSEDHEPRLARATLSLQVGFCIRGAAICQVLSGKDRLQPIARERTRDSGFFAHRDFRLELISDCLSDFALDGKDVSHVAIVGLRPEMGIGAGVDELRVDAQMIARPLDAAFQEMRDAKLLSDLAASCAACRSRKTRSRCG